jgi:hypothetical protein
MDHKRRSSRIDHHLLAQVQMRTTGENAHDICRLLAQYLELSSMASDAECEARLVGVEARLRVFRETGVVPEKQSIKISPSD